MIIINSFLLPTMINIVPPSYFFQNIQIKGRSMNTALTQGKMYQWNSLDYASLAPHSGQLMQYFIQYFTLEKLKPILYDIFWNYEAVSLTTCLELFRNDLHWTF